MHFAQGLFFCYSSKLLQQRLITIIDFVVLNACFDGLILRTNTFSSWKHQCCESGSIVFPKYCKIYDNSTGLHFKFHYGTSGCHRRCQEKPRILDPLTHVVSKSTNTGSSWTCRHQGLRIGFKRRTLIVFNGPGLRQGWNAFSRASFGPEGVQ